jgi:hypothetical protein
LVAPRKIDLLNGLTYSIVEYVITFVINRLRLVVGF